MTIRMLLNSGFSSIQWGEAFTAVCLLCLTITLQAQSQTKEAEYLRRADSLIAQMTIEEKLGQLHQLNGGTFDHQKGAFIEEKHFETIRAGKIGSFLNIYGAELTRKAQEAAMQSRLKIPLIFALDVIHGYRTTFPIPLAEASSWDMALMEESARIAAIEASAAGVHWTFAPMVDIARDPRWGRIIEGAGEDPYFGALAAVARVKGFQGKDLALPNTILACAKHFAAYGAAEGGRDYNTVDLSERALREIYFPPFKAAVDAGVVTFMASFNEIAGMPSSINRTLMTDVLRKEWGFKGFVISDWASISEVKNHGAAATTREAGALALAAGLDMDMESNAFIALKEDVESGRVPVALVNQAVRRILYAKFLLGLFDDPFRYCSIDREKELVLNPKHRERARFIAERSIVLLKNEKDLLPLSRDIKTIAVIGSLAQSKRDMLGEWEVVGRPEDVVTILEGIKAKVSPKTKVLYATGCQTTRGSESFSKAGFRDAVATARRADAVVVVLGETADMSGEAHSRASIDLPGVQEELLKELKKTGKPIILVLSNGRPLSTAWASEEIPAILETWQLGIEAGNAIANVLFGNYNPSGKLTVTIPRHVGQIPMYYNHKNTGRPISLDKPEDRYKSRYIDLDNRPLYPFGYGLSYTRFEYSNLTVSNKTFKKGESLTLQIDVQNIGKRDGEEVIQVYLRDHVAQLTRPVKELKAFEKVMLKAGEKKTIRFRLSPEAFSYLGPDMKPTLEAGEFTVFVGSNSEQTARVVVEMVD